MPARPSWSGRRGHERGRPGDRAGERARPPVPRRARAGERRLLGRRSPDVPGRRREGAAPGGADPRVSASLEATLASIRPADVSAGDRAERTLDAKTKPPGSLGRLETLACRVAAIRGELPSQPLAPAIVVAAADHGVWHEGVAPYPQPVTSQMLTNFARGG